MLITSDQLDEVPEERAELFAQLLRERRLTCRFPRLGSARRKTIVQESARPDGSVLVNLFNAGDEAERIEADPAIGLSGPIILPPHASHLMELAPSRKAAARESGGTTPSAMGQA